MVKHEPRHLGSWDGTVRHLGQDSSALRSELSLGHFGTSADLSGQFGPTRLVLKCPGSEVSWVRSVRNSTGPQNQSSRNTCNKCQLARPYHAQFRCTTTRSVRDIPCQKYVLSKKVDQNSPKLERTCYA